jgi:hypothetical protein
MIWTFYEFVHGGEDAQRGIISDDLSMDVQAELDVILAEHLGIKMNHEWGLPDYLNIGSGMGEIRVTVGKVEHRIYGSFAPGRKFRMWLVATKRRVRKGKQATDPPNAIEKARKRMRDFELHRIGRVRIYLGPEDI